ncbi:MAG: VCBS repeat-containing protein [Candidatus Doudnabacteria bacterium]|nr:VCBS repeat-containing protein [Candidatus Doudnabacteria bacterium]
MKRTQYLGLRRLVVSFLVFLVIVMPLRPVFAQEVEASVPVTTEPVQQEPQAISEPEPTSMADETPIPTEQADELGTDKTEAPIGDEDPVSEEAVVKEDEPKPEEEVAKIFGGTQGVGLQFKIPSEPQNSVDESTGALIYEYPIVMPEGRLGMTPAVSLKYNSQNITKVDSIVGLGWELTIPYIQRERAKGVEGIYTKANFVTSFSGNLVPTTDISSSPYTVYYSEVDDGSFQKHTFNSDNTWTMTDKSGRVYTFGATAASRQDNPVDTSQVYKWMISKISDVHGNEIQYSYTKDNGQIYPSQIVYTYHSTSPAIHNVSFTYNSPSSYGATTYNAAFPVVTSKVLATIDVTTTAINGVSTNSYSLVNTNAQFIKQKLVTRIDRSYTSTITESVPYSESTSFSYSTKTPGWQQGTHSLEGYLVRNSDYIYKDIFTADFDANGFTDVLISHHDIPSQKYNRLMMNNGSTFTESSSAWSLPTHDLSSNAFIADINGDKYPDLLPRQSDPNPVYLNTGSGFSVDNSNNWKISTYVPEALICGANVGDSNSFDTNSFLHDINEDGKNDIVFFGGSSDFRVFLNNGNGFTLSNNYTFTPQSGANFTIPTVCTGDLDADGYQTLIDVNNDGLKDYFHVTHGTYLNTGSGFAYAASYQIDTAEMDRTGLGDVNGDGLLDYIGFKWTSGGNYCARLLFNDGNGFKQINPTNYPTNCDNSGVWDFSNLSYTGGNSSFFGTLMDLTADGLPDIVGRFSSYDIRGKVRAVNDGVSSWVNNSNAGDQWVDVIAPSYGKYFDINSDGVLDFITPLTSWGYGTMPASMTYMGKPSIPNRLTQITNRLGAQTVVDFDTAPTDLYDRDSAPMPVVKKITTQNLGSGQPDMVTQYDYEKGHYSTNPLTSQVKFAGFSKVTATESGIDLTPLRVTDTYFHQGDNSDSGNSEYQDHISKIGKAYRIEIKDGSGNLYSKTLNTWEHDQIYEGRDFVKLAQTMEFSFDGNTNHRDKAVSYEYDNFLGNTTKRIDWGEVTGSADGTFTDVGNDKIVTDLIYATGSSHDVVEMISSEISTDQSLNKVSETHYYYDNLSLGSIDKGNETKVEKWKSGSDYINEQKAYNSLGLVTQTTDPRGKNLVYAYDSHNLFPATVTNHLSQATQYQYHYFFGKPLQVTDVNNRVFKTLYDGAGRIIEQREPDLSNPTALVSKFVNTYSTFAGGELTRHVEYMSASEYIDSYTYSDALGREVQQRLATEDSGNYRVNDKAYDALGRLQKESSQYFSSGDAKTVATTTTNLYTTTSYDPLDRVTAIANNIGIITNTFDDWTTTVTDARGKVKVLYNDARGNLVKVDESNSGAVYTTNYEYNSNNNLVKITDALGNVRNFTYDALGRRLTAQDLHAPTDVTFGTWTYTYDNNGNITSVVDPNNQTINYTYDDLGRLLTEDFTGQSETELTYTYDSGTDGMGRLSSVVSPGANTSYLYNAHGGVKQEIKTINSTSYQTDYTYDRQGNQLEITNPDGSKVKYTYNFGGQLETVQRKETTDTSFINVVNDFDYGPHGKITLQVNQNGSQTSNIYDATKLYRLSSKITTISGGSKVQGLTYSYDNNSNITQAVDNSNTNSVKTVAYTYDDLNRLLSSTATGVAAGQSTYTEVYSYDAIGNILTKATTVGGGATINTTYSYAGSAGSSYANPHAVTSISDGINTTNFTYDNNGNMIGEGSKTFAFDYNNRMTQSVGVSGSGPTTVSFNSLAGDGAIYHQSSSWDTAHDASVGSYASFTVNNFYVRAGKNTSTSNRIERGFLPFDTSSLPDSANITSAKLKVYVYSKLNNDNDGTDWVTVTQATQPSTTVLTTGDYDLAGSINNPVEGVDAGQRKDITNVSVGGYLTFDLNVTGRGWVNTSGSTKLSLREGHDATDSAFVGTSGQYNELRIISSEYTGTSVDPILEVTYGSAPQVVTTNYKYDHTGQRVSLSNGTKTDVYPSADYNTDGTTPVKHIFGAGQTVATIKGSGVGATAYLVHTDHLTGSSAVTNSGGTLEELMDYFPFGNIRLDQKVGSFDEQRKYTGHEYDVDTGLSYMEARYYNPNIGRFLSQDPVFLALGNEEGVQQKTQQELQEILSDPQLLNSYSYARNNPLAYIDENGEWPSWSQIKTGFQTAWNVAKPFVQNKINQVQNSWNSYNAYMDTPEAQQKSRDAAMGGMAYLGPIGGTDRYFGFGVGSINSVGSGVNLTSRGALHIQKGHTLSGQAPGNNKSYFFNDVDYKGIITKYGNQAKGAIQGNGNVQRILDMGRPVGWDATTGGATSFMTIITDKAGTVITSHPGLPTTIKAIVKTIKK